MKNIFNKVSFIFVLLLISITSISLASNELTNSVNYDNEVVPISMEGGNPVDVEFSQDEDSTTQKNYFYAGSDNVNLTTPVIGDVFIVTSGEVNIDTSISGNVFVVASYVTISESAYVQASLFNVSSSLDILGSIGNNVYTVANDLLVKGTINNDLFSASSTSNVEEGLVYGNTNCAIIDTDEDSNTFDIKDYITSLISFIILVLVVFIISKWINCKFINTYPDFVSTMPKSLLYGLLGLIVTPILCIILLICGITANLAFVLMAIYFIALIIASSTLIIVLSRLMADKLHTKFEQSNETLLTILSIVIISIIYKLLQLTPTFGIVVTFAVVMLGIGILIRNIVPAKKLKNS